MSFPVLRCILCPSGVFKNCPCISVVYLEVQNSTVPVKLPKCLPRLPLDPESYFRDSAFQVYLLKQQQKQLFRFMYCFAYYAYAYAYCNHCLYKNMEPPTMSISRRVDKYSCKIVIGWNALYTNENKWKRTTCIYHGSHSQCWVKNKQI